MGQGKKMLLSYDDPSLLTGKQASYHTQERNPELSLKISGPWAAIFFLLKKNTENPLHRTVVMKEPLFYFYQLLEGPPRPL